MSILYYHTKWVYLPPVHSPPFAWTSTCHTPIFLIYIVVIINDQNLIFIVLILSYFCDSFYLSSHNTQKPLHLVFQNVKDIIFHFPPGELPQGTSRPPVSIFSLDLLWSFLSWDFSSLSTDTSLWECSVSWIPCFQLYFWFVLFW